MKLLIENNIFDESRMERLSEYVKDVPHEYIGVVPFSHEITSNVPLEGNNYIPYGSNVLLKRAQSLGWKGVYYNDNFDYVTQLAVGLPMLNFLIQSVEDCLVNAKYFKEPMFIRPSKDLKDFPGGVRTSEEIQELLIAGLTGGNSQVSKIDIDDDLILSYPQRIFQEWRCFIVGGELVSISQYRRDGKLEYSNNIEDAPIAFIYEILQGWLPHNNFVIDIAKLYDSYKIIEFNCINCSGFYANDMSSVFKELINYEKTRSIVHNSGSDKIHSFSY